MDVHAFTLHPDLTLTCDGRDWMLRIDAPDLTGTISSRRQDTVMILAEEYGRWRAGAPGGSQSPAGTPGGIPGAPDAENPPERGPEAVQGHLSQTGSPP